MSVPKNKRSLSQFEVYEQAMKLRTIMTNLLLKDFGVKNRIKDLKLISKDMPPKLAREIEVIIESYYIDDPKVRLEYPLWFLEKERDVIDDFLIVLVHSILQANKIYISTKEEYTERRLLIDKAIYTCHSILLELCFVSDVLHIPKSKMENYIKMIDVEISYFLLPFGKVLKRLSADSISRERRRLKKYRKLLDEGRITFTEIRNAYQSWLGNAKQFSSYKSIQNMNRLFNSLYGEYL